MITSVWYTVTTTTAPGSSASRTEENSTDTRFHSNPRTPNLEWLPSPPDIPYEISKFGFQGPWSFDVLTCAFDSRSKANKISQSLEEMLANINHPHLSLFNN